MKKLQIMAVGICAAGLLAAENSWADLSYPDGNPGDWTGGNGTQTVPSGTGGITAPNGGTAFTQLKNLDNDYQTNYGNGPHSFYGNGGSSTYSGAFYQSASIYIDTAWAQPLNPGAPSFWLDMTPYHADVNNYGAEHSFQFNATGSQVNVAVDGQASSLLNIATSGWYTFQITYQKGINPTDPVISDMNIFDASGSLLATTQVTANSPGGPFLSSDLAGNGYLWFTVWQNGFAGDTLNVANVQTGALPVPEPQTTALMALAFLALGVGPVRRFRKSRMSQ